MLPLSLKPLGCTFYTLHNNRLECDFLGLLLWRRNQVWLNWIHFCWGLYPFAWAVIMKDCGWGGLNIRNLFLTLMEAEGPWSRSSRAGFWWELSSGLQTAALQLCSHMTPGKGRKGKEGGREREIMGSQASLLIMTPILSVQGPTFMTLFSLISS